MRQHNIWCVCVCVRAFCVKMCVGLQSVLCEDVCRTAVRSVWRCVPECSPFSVKMCAGLQSVLCEDVCWTAVRSV